MNAEGVRDYIRMLEEKYGTFGRIAGHVVALAVWLGIVSVGFGAFGAMLKFIFEVELSLSLSLLNELPDILISLVVLCLAVCAVTFPFAVCIILVHRFGRGRSIRELWIRFVRGE